MPKESELYGDEFQLKSKYERTKMGGNPLDWHNPPERYKSYSSSEKKALPKPENPSSHPLQQNLELRRSIRNYSSKPLTIEQLSYLLWASSGITKHTSNFEYRSAPSAGGLYPIETYLVVNNIIGIPQGIYHYNILDHVLDVVKVGDFRDRIITAELDQEMTGAAPVVFIWSAMVNRTKWKYRERGYRYIYLDAGHIAENLALAAVDLNLGSCQIAAFYDEELDDLLDLDGAKETTIYSSVVGYSER